MIKIGYIVSTLENSGPVNIMYNIIKYLDKKLFDVYIYTLSEEKEKSRLEDFIKIGCCIKKVDVANIEIFFGNLSKVEKILQEDKVEVLHSHCLRSNIILSKLKVNVKKICTIHANIKKDYEFQFGKLKGFILEKIYLNTLKKIENRICCSKSVYNAMRALTKKKLKYIINGVDLENFKIEKSKKESREILKIDEKEKIFISVGSLCARKDALFIAENIKKIKFDNYKLFFLGEGIQRKQIEELNDSKIILAGKVSNVQDYLNAADFYISASNSEGMPNSVLEASAFKLPLILSNIEPHLEIYELNQFCGEIFNKNSKLDFQNKIEKILSEDYEKLSTASYEVVYKYLNAKNMSKLYSEYYL